MIAFIDQHRSAYGVEPICRVLPIAPSTYRLRVHCRSHPETASPRAQRDAELRVEIQRVFLVNVYRERQALTKAAGG
jgi:putative transposase